MIVWRIPREHRGQADSQQAVTNRPTDQHVILIGSLLKIAFAQGELTESNAGRLELMSWDGSSTICV
jgi:hypothetical protein